MVTTRAVGDATDVDETTLDALIEQDPHKPGRHNARFVEAGTHLWAVLGTWRRTRGDIAATAAEWGMPPSAIRAAVRYYERHRDLFDAYFLLEAEEFNSRQELAEKEQHEASNAPDGDEHR